MMSDSGRSREEKEVGWKRFDARFEKKPPASNRGVSFSPPAELPSELPLCCQVRERITFYNKWAQLAFDQGDNEGLHTYNACYGDACLDFEKVDRCETCEQFYVRSL